MEPVPAARFRGALITANRRAARNCAFASYGTAACNRHRGGRVPTPFLAYLRTALRRRKECDPGGLFDSLDDGAARESPCRSIRSSSTGGPSSPLRRSQTSSASAPAARLVRSGQPSDELRSAAFGLTLANPLAESHGVDLARALKPAVSIGDVFPYGELLLHGALLGAVSLFSIGVSAEANHQLKAVLGGLKAFSWLQKQDQSKLDAEKKLIQERLKAIGVFRDTRVNWSGSFRTIASAMPESTIITGLAGDAEVEAGSRSGPSRAKKKLIVSFETPLAGNGTLPQEIDGFLAALRG